MKRIVFIALTLAALAVFILHERKVEEPAVATPAPIEESTELKLQTDATEVFRRAFWREPGAGDRVLHAERREWVSETNGVRRWQWFIAVEPSEGFMRWLWDENPFSLRPFAAFDTAPGTLPDWFPAKLADAECRQAADRSMTILRKDGIIFATDAGHGFTITAHPAAEPRTAAAPPIDQRSPRR